MNSKAWNKGFEAGQAFRKACPYLPDTAEEWDWHTAWLEGASKALGMRYCKTASEREARHHSSAHAYRPDHAAAARPVAPDLISLTLALFSVPKSESSRR